MTNRNFIITLNNPNEETDLYLERMFRKLKAAYVNGQLEKGKEGTLHIQAFLNFKTGIRFTKIKKFDSRLHIQPVRVDNGASSYCLKEDTRVAGPWQFGERPIRRNNKTDWQSVYDAAKSGNFDSIPADIKVKHYGNLQKIAKDNLTFPSASNHTKGVWIYGTTGVGKSRKARQMAPEAYLKMANKWWDGYTGQSEIILEDIDKSHKCLSHHIKLWTDHYSFVAETKGGAISPDYQLFIITSQYEIEEIFEERDAEAIRRRCEVIQL